MMHRLFPDLGFVLGESPVWDDRSARLYCVDIEARRLYRLDPAGPQVESFDWPEKISCIGLTDPGPELLVAGVSGLWRFHPETGVRELWAAFPDLPTGQRPNDGKVGPDGAFWVGTMEDRNDRGPAGRLYRFDPDGGVQIMAEGLTTPNGLDWSPDGRQMYRAETRALEILQHDFDPATGTVSEPRPFVRLTPEQGKPDGAAVAADGSYWVCGIYAGRVWGFHPDGRPAGSLPVDAAMVTMPCFGGAALDQLYVTSLAQDGQASAGLFGGAAVVTGQPDHPATPLQGRPAWRFSLPPR